MRILYIENWFVVNDFVAMGQIMTCLMHSNSMKKGLTSSRVQCSKGLGRVQGSKSFFLLNINLPSVTHSDLHPPSALAICLCHFFYYEEWRLGGSPDPFHLLPAPSFFPPRLCKVSRQKWWAKLGLVLPSLSLQSKGIVDINQNIKLNCDKSYADQIQGDRKVFDKE